jgi:hypothetical protein
MKTLRFVSRRCLPDCVPHSALVKTERPFRHWSKGSDLGSFGAEIIELCTRWYITYC